MLLDDTLLMRHNISSQTPSICTCTRDKLFSVYPVIIIIIIIIIIKCKIIISMISKYLESEISSVQRLVKLNGYVSLIYMLIFKVQIFCKKYTSSSVIIDLKLEISFFYLIIIIIFMRQRNSFSSMLSLL